MKQYYSRTCYDIYLFLHIKCYKDVSNSFSPFQSSSSEITKANSATESIDTNLLYVYSQIHRHIYFYMGFPPLCHFWGLLQKWIYITFCFTICPFHLIDEGYASRSIHVVLIFFSLRSCKIFRSSRFHAIIFLLVDIQYIFCFHKGQIRGLPLWK